MSADKLQVQALVRIAKPSHLTVSKIAVSGTTATVTHDAASGAAIQVDDTFRLSNFGYADSIQPPKLEDKIWTVASVVGKYSSERAAREWSTVVIVIVVFISCFLF